MPNVKTHDKIGNISAIGTSMLASQYLPIADALLLGIVVAVATWYLSPDLDLPSKSYFRWGIFRYYWLPYQKIIKHRSWLSHSSFISGTLRFVYICWPLFLVPINTYYLGIVWFGICIADTIHCIADWM